MDYNGKKVNEFENNLSKYLKVKYVVAEQWYFYPRFTS